MAIKFSEKELTEELYNLEDRQGRNVEYLNDKVQKAQDHPDAKKHQIVSFIKSGVRIIGYCFIPFNLVTAAIILVASEVIGIIEELV